MLYYINSNLYGGGGYYKLTCHGGVGVMTDGTILIAEKLLN